MEGDKIVSDLLHNHPAKMKQLVATAPWLNRNRQFLSPEIPEILEADPADMARITSFETVPPVFAVLDIPVITPDEVEIFNSVSLGLDNIQDPGNLGTIIRTADWFGIRNIFCSPDCADCYNPKVVQASMGARTQCENALYRSGNYLEENEKRRFFSGLRNLYAG